MVETVNESPAEQALRREIREEARRTVLGLGQRAQRPWPWILPILLDAVSDELGRRLGGETAAKLLEQEAARHRPAAVG